MAGYNIRQDKSYRRGLILGLTIAEIMILLIFVLLMALATALSNREKRLEAVEDDTGSKLVEAIQRAYPEAKSSEDFYKELVRAIEAREATEKFGSEGARQLTAEDAALGSKVSEAAQKAGSNDPYKFAENAIKRAGAGKKGEWPPFFSLSEAGGYYFESGKATLRPDFERKLKSTIIPLLRRNVDDYGVDIVEVMGHTDEVPMVGNSNLDSLLIAASASRAPIEALRSTDNAGLAMARAVAVVRILRADARLNGITILPFSGAQMVVPGDRVANGSATKSDQTRRRIEIRLRRASEQIAPQDKQNG